MSGLREELRGGWRGPGGGREVLAIAYPLILSQMSYTLETFLDRVFLTWYSPEAVAGAVTGVFSTWAPMGLCIGTAEYLTTFVAQYSGAGRPERVGPAVWQGIYFALLAGALIASLNPLAGPLFALAGHEATLQMHEVTYSRILMIGAFPIILMAALSTFFAGRGQTGVILKVNLLSAEVDVVLNYLWIFGHAGFPRAGVAGAAWSTVVAQALGAVVFLALILRAEFRRAYATLTGWRFEPALFWRLLRFGFPAGLQTSVEIVAFAIFLLIVGRFGVAPLAASSLAFSLNMIVFMPTLGIGVAVSSLVGRYLGGERPDLAERSTWSGLRISMVYMSACGALYVFAPRLLLGAYAVGTEGTVVGGVTEMAVVLLRFVALYSIFDMMNVVFAAGLKGAGDTTYPLVLTIGLSWIAMLLPTWVLCVHFDFGLYTAWSLATLYVVLVGLLMMRRFRAGRWKTMRVIEPRITEIDVPQPEPA